MERIWAPIVRPLLEALRPAVVVAYVTNDGTETPELETFCRSTKARLHTIEPARDAEPDYTPGPDDPHPSETTPGLSLAGQNPDVVLIEGLRSWRSAVPELETLAARASEELGRFPLVIVHSVDRDRGSTTNAGEDSAMANEGMSRSTVLDPMGEFRTGSRLQLELMAIPEVDVGIMYPAALAERGPEAVEFIRGLDSPVMAHSLLELGEALRTESRDLEAVSSRYERLLSRRSVRLALRLARTARPLLRLMRRLRGEAAKPDSGRAERQDNEGVGRRKRPPTRRTQRRLVRKIARLRPGSPETTGPLVSIIVLTRNGAEHLVRLLRGLDQTTYRSFEVIAVDNGSTDGTDEVLQTPRSFPIHVIRNEANVSFSEGNNQGAGAADGDYLLLMNNDVEPVNPGWLGAMVDALEESESAAACGALLVHPVRGEPETDLTVQHSGTRFSFSPRGVRGINTAARDPLDPALGGVAEVPAATAATLLVRREAFDGVHGLSEGYVYGAEDVDLCLKLKDRGGRVLVTGQAVLFHHESATQDRSSDEIISMHKATNRQLLMETWGPRLTRSVQRDRLTGAGRWALDRRKTVAITLTEDDVAKGWGDYYTAHELGDAFAGLGWHVVYAERYRDNWYRLDEEVDLLISLLDSYDVGRAPAGAVTLAWVRNWVDRWLQRPWFDRYDLVAVSSHKGSNVISQRSRFDPPVVPLATNPTRFVPGHPNPTFECDYAFTGNNWGHGRGIIPLLDVHPGERFLLFGKGWDEDPRVGRYWRGHLEYELLPDLYRSTKILLDDTAGPTLPHAFLNGRVFDGLAAGALVISDNVEGSEEMFDGLLPTYRSGEELRAHLDRYLGDDSVRLELVERLRDRVTANHSYEDRPRELLDIALQHVEQPKAAIKVAVPDEASKPLWGDTHFGDALASALTRLGMPTEVHILPEWDLPQNQAVDVVIHVRGLSNYSPKPAHVNVLWIISHPDEVSIRECEKYDLVLVASRSYSEMLETRVEVPVVFMPQATDGRRFHPVEPSTDLASEVLFVGNSREQERPGVDWAAEAGLPLTVYGQGWKDRLQADAIRAEHFPNRELARLYASTKVVLNDHWPDMRDAGFVSNRIFDALASGSVVVSDRVEGLSEIFGGLVPTYSDPVELREVIAELLEDEERRRQIAIEGARLVLDQHTFDQRAEQIMSLLKPRLADRRKDLEGAALEP